MFYAHAGPAVSCLLLELSKGSLNSLLHILLTLLQPCHVGISEGC